MRWTPLAIALFVQAALLLWRLDRLPVWGDEQFTLDVVALPWSEIAARLRLDIHPPLYFALAKLWAALPLPGAEVVRLRAFSALTALGATAALDRLILRGRAETVRRWTLAVWALSPAVVLYGRMARSYALQTLLATVALCAAMRLIERPTRRNSAIAGAALAALLYTHYLPGLAVAAALAAGVLVTRRPAPAGTALALAALAYLPWAVILAEGLARAADKRAYAITGSWLAELPVRAGYAALGLVAGEAHTVATFGLGLALCAGLLPALWLGWRSEPPGRKWALACAAAAGFAGAAQWVSFPFMPARLLWLLPWLLALTVAGVFRLARPRVGLTVWLALLAAGQAFYVRQEGFLNKGYLIPFEEIAGEVRPADIVLADATNCDPSPLRAALPPGARFLAIASEDDADRAFEAASAGGVVWRLRTSRDVTPRRIQDELDRRLLDVGFERDEARMLPYSTLDRLLLQAMGESDPPTHHLLWIRFERDDR